MQYSRLLERLLSVNIHGGMKLGLENCMKLNEALEYPTRAFQAIHVAGTNGKGSVVTKIAAALEAAGRKVGLYTSPHIACFRERIRINGVMISEEKVAQHLSHIFKIIDQHKIPATFFEITTLLAFTYFATENIDIAIVETGLGGRLDATNIVSPIVTVITSISLEHTDILGNTLELIAKEKAGILKPNVPAVIGPRVPIHVIQQAAARQGCPYTLVETCSSNFNEENNAVAKAVLKLMQVPDDAILYGLSKIPPCRFETWFKSHLSALGHSLPLPEAVIMDVGHNPDGIRHLIRAITEHFPGQKYRFVVGLSQNKDIPGCLKLINEAASHVHVVEASNSRAAPKQILYDCFISLGRSPPDVTREDSISRAIQRALSMAAHRQEIVVVCGTFFIMAEARSALGIQEEQDSIELQEVMRI